MNYKHILEDTLRLQAEDSGHPYESTGMDYSDYAEFIDILETYKPNCLLEYGSGYSSYFLKRVIAENNLSTKFRSYESDLNYYNYLLQDKFNLADTIELCQMEEEPTKMLGQGSGRYVHSLEGLEDVDFVIIDGPGHSGYGKHIDINTNVEWIEEQTGRTMNIWVDGRNHQMFYYDKLDKSHQVINFNNEHYWPNWDECWVG